MTVSELIQELKNFPKNMDVEFSFGYGDHWHTQVSSKIEQVEFGCVQFSSYHNMNKLIDEEKEIDEDKGKQKKVVVLS